LKEDREKKVEVGQLSLMLEKLSPTMQKLRARMSNFARCRISCVRL